MKITQSKTQSHYYYWTPGVLSVFQSLSLSLALVSLSHPGNVSKPTVGLHHKQIMSNCKCVCFLKGGWCEGEWSVPPPHQVALPCLPAAPLCWGLILAVTALSEIKMGTPPIAFPPSQECLCGWANSSCACAHAGNCKDICINTHSSFLPSTVVPSRE